MFVSTILFFFILVINIFLDFISNKTYKCYSTSPKRIQIIILLILHHIFNIFANFGWLFYSHTLLILYVISIPTMYLHWYINNNKCRVTSIINNMCGWEDKTYFNDMFNMLGLKKYESWDTIYHNVLIGVGISIAIYKINYT